MSGAELTAAAARVRRMILEMAVRAGKGHIGGAFSATEILVALYHGGVLRLRPGEPDWPGRDRFLLSKGHACLVQYAVLADLDILPRAHVERFGDDGELLGNHPDRRIPGVEADSGSLGNGLGIAAGLALGAQLDGDDRLSVVLLGDGECYEGAVWEAAAFAAHERLGRLVAIVDRNGLCATAPTESVNGLEPLVDKWRAFGWEVREVDGHSFSELASALGDARERPAGPPLCLLARTVKGKGVSFMEGEVGWHHGVPDGERLERARRELAA